MAAGEYPLRVIVKNQRFGVECVGDRTGKSECNLQTSWGRPRDNHWRPTAMEVNELLQLCTFKYRCEIQKANLMQQPGQEVPQIFLMRVLRGADGNPLPALPPITTTSAPTGSTV